MKYDLEKSGALEAILIAMIVVSVLLAFLSQCSAAECLSSPAEVRRVHGVEAHSYWGYHVPGHEGTQCWSNVPINQAALRESKAGDVRKEVAGKRRQTESDHRSKLKPVSQAGNDVTNGMSALSAADSSDAIVELLLLRACVDDNAVAWYKLADIVYNRWMTEQNLWKRSDEQLRPIRAASRLSR